MKGKKQVYRVMWEDSLGYRDGRYGKITYQSKPKGKRDKAKVKRK